jgi:hypothetical protein
MNPSEPFKAPAIGLTGGLDHALDDCGAEGRTVCRRHSWTACHALQRDRGASKRNESAQPRMDVNGHGWGLNAETQKARRIAEMCSPKKSRSVPLRFSALSASLR